MEHREKSEDKGRDSYTFDAIEGLENLSHNDYLQTMFHNAQMFEDRLNNDPTALAEQGKMIQQLDKDWLYMNHVLPVSGIGYIKTGRLNAHIPEYTPIKYTKETDLESRGFVVLTFAALLGDEELIHYRVALYFIHNGHTVAILKEDLLSELPNYSLDASEKRLLYHHADEVLRITDRLEKHDDAAPYSSPIMQFTDYAVDFYPHAKYEEDYMTDMEVYLYDAMQFDTELPYIVDYNQSQLDVDIEPSYERVLARPDEIRFIPVDDDDTATPRRHIPWIELTVYDPDPQKKSSTLSLPFSALRQFQSIRNLANPQ